MAAMGQGFSTTYQPDLSKTTIYNKRYQRYKKLGSFISSQTNHE
jgi:L-ribulokinase